MGDQIGRSTDRDGIPITHLCSHVSQKLDVDGDEVFVFHHPANPITTLTVTGPPGVAAYCAGGISPDLGAIRGTPGELPSSDWEALSSSFYEAVDSYLPAKFLLGEDIYESDIFVEAVKIALNPSRAVRTFVKGVAPLLKGLVRPTIRDAHVIAKAAGNSFLSYNFGVKPALSDIRDCIFAHRNVKQRLNVLYNNKGSFLPIRVKARASARSSASHLTDNTYVTMYHTYTGDVVRTDTIGCYGRVRTDLNHADDWKAYAQYFGVQHIFGLAWELIPFSFVFDWVTNQQERLRNLTRLRLGGPFSELRGIWASSLTQAQFQTFVAPGAGYGDFSGLVSSNVKPSHVATGCISTYDRWLSIPEGFPALDFSQLGLFHILATGSLILQRT